MDVYEEDVLYHYGILRKSGRYPWGSGGNSEQRSRSFLKATEDLRDRGLSDVEIARGLMIGHVDKKTGEFRPSTTDLRALRTLTKNKVRAADLSTVMSLKGQGYSNVAIGERMGINESSVRALLRPAAKDKTETLNSVASMLKGEVKAQGLVDVGVGTEMLIGVTETKLRASLAMLKEDGYEVVSVQVAQPGTSNKTTVKVLAPPGTTYRDIVSDTSKIGSLSKHSEDGGRSFLGLKRPEILSSSRVKINYAEDGGEAADGTMYIRRGVDDLSMGGKNYAQVRIAVDGTHYLKGMAMYSDTLPNGKPWPRGVDVIFNTNKSSTGNKLDALKPLKTKSDSDPSIDWDNPFGAVIKPNGQKGVLNILNEEGDWDKWSKSLSSQVLSKQPNNLAKSQLEAKYKMKKEEFDEIMSLTNPVVRRKLLEEFASDADSSSVHMKAAGLPGQRTQVILPMNSMKDGEIYAPNFNNGDRVALVRFPHGGRFEIPELTVNNRQPTAKSIIGNARDAVGINAKVAARLSGADFDGDTVLVIPNNQGKIKSASPLVGLKDFDAKASYPAYEGMPKLKDAQMQRLMGEVSNLITDMTIRGATSDDLARAVRHSMVIIDAAKHKLNYQQSAKDNGIKNLKEKYQGVNASGRVAGASTIISRAGSEVRVADRKERKASEGGKWDPKTGKVVYTPTGESYKIVSPKGVETTVLKTTKAKALAEVDDAFKLTSGGSAKNPGRPIEAIYATHSNKMKDLANQARKEALKTPTIQRSPSAAKTYAKQVEKLKTDLNTALRNAPVERKAIILANTIIKQKQQANPDMSKADLKKIKGQALTEARIRTGAGKKRVPIDAGQWEAIQSNALSQSMLTKVLRNADPEQVKALATPRARTVMTDGKMARAMALLATGRYTQSEIAAQLGVPVSTLHDAIS